jgi:hypothetical protein
VGELAINLADRILYSKNASGTVFSLGDGGAAVAYLFSAAVSGNYLYIGRLAESDIPNSGSPDNATAWTIYRITTNAAGDATATQSATGAWSNKQNLTFA